MITDGKVAVAATHRRSRVNGRRTATFQRGDLDDEMQPCGEICNLDSAQDYLTWKLTIWAAPHWTYVTASGDTFISYGAPAESKIRLILWKNGKWTLDTQNGLGAPCDFRVFI